MFLRYQQKKIKGITEQNENTTISGSKSSQPVFEPLEEKVFSAFHEEEDQDDFIDDDNDALEEENFDDPETTVFEEDPFGEIEEEDQAFNDPSIDLFDDEEQLSDDDDDYM